MLTRATDSFGTNDPACGCHVTVTTIRHNALNLLCVHLFGITVLRTQNYCDKTHESNCVGLAQSVACPPLAR